jgi:hypothetical protein
LGLHSPKEAADPAAVIPKSLTPTFPNSKSSGDINVVVFGCPQLYWIDELTN